MMHQDFRRFGFEGESDNIHFERMKPQYEKWCIQEMRTVGFVPVIGLGPYWTTWYNDEKQNFGFKLSIHGVKVGRDEISQLEGITVEGRRIMRPTVPPKSNPSSLLAE